MPIKPRLRVGSAADVWTWVERYEAERRRIAKRVAQRRELYRKFKLEGF